MTMLEEVLAANGKFVDGFAKCGAPLGGETSKLPQRHLAIVTCMDTRLVDFLEPALGIGRGEAKVIKNAGNSVTGPFESTVRSLIVGVFELGVKEIMVIGHHDCGVAHTSSQQLIEKMLRRGIPEAAIRMVRHELEQWIDEFHHPVQNVEHVVDRIRMNPLIPADVPVHGLIFDPKSGKLDVVVSGYGPATEGK